MDVRPTYMKCKQFEVMLEVVKVTASEFWPVILQLIREKEREEKNAYMVDKKTVMRLVAILVKEKKINIINTVLLDGSKQKNVCHMISNKGHMSLKNVT